MPKITDPDPANTPKNTDVQQKQLKQAKSNRIQELFASKTKKTPHTNPDTPRLINAKNTKKIETYGNV